MLRHGNHHTWPRDSDGDDDDDSDGDNDGDSDCDDDNDSNNDGDGDGVREGDVVNRIDEQMKLGRRLRSWW